MSDSPLATYARWSPNCTRPRRGAIKGVAIHCTAGGRDLPARRTVDLARFTTYDRKSGASCHYVVGGDGSIAQACREEDRAWCTSDPIDHDIVTIEVASDAQAPNGVNDAALDALLDLLVDICQRNGIPRLLWRGDKALMGQWDKQNMVVHRWTAPKACPGDWLYSHHGQIAAEVNRRLEAAKAGKDGETMDVKEITSCANTGDKPSDWAREATDYCKRKGIFAGDGAGNYGWQQPITREATAQIIYNVLEAAGMLGALPDKLE